ncbi:hypothetical protein [Hyalangium versicolor]|uniref:hypothetical protein n=1 Tax=Hyalangium versicolor TaxID=2861190 RepID=UPI001CCF8400|nr:hypothetical protein [Hyalangium versicolor]
MKRLARLPVWVVMALCLVTGCASQRESFLRDRAGEHVYKQPLSEIWPRVKAVLDDQGYYFEEAPEGFLLETDWKQTDRTNNLGSAYAKLLVQGTEVKEGGTNLRVLRKELSARQVVVDQMGRPVGPITSAQSAMVDSSHTGYSIQTEVWKHAERDLQMEWELLRAIEPETAASLQKDAEAKFPK